MREAVAEKLYFIPGRRGGRFPHCNSLFIADGGGAVVDPASDAKELKLLAGEGVGVVILSHYHTDHVRDLKLFPGAAIYAHQADAPALRDFDEMIRSTWGNLLDSSGNWRGRKRRELGGEWGWTVARELQDGEELVFGQIQAEVVHTPGHTPGHCCFWFPDSQILFAADFDLAGFGPWYGNADSNLDDTLASIEKLKRFQPRLTITGHEAGIVRGDLTARLDAFARVIAEREARILECLREPLTHEELVRRGTIYGSSYSPDNTNHWMEWRMVWHHLRSLEKRGVVRQEAGKYRRLI
jgi:glyoxylase-like metal-dependent hydrolase (beta-lactamase superfamily II)